MVQTEITNDHVWHYSDNGMMLQQVETGALYDEAIDVENSGYTYTETAESTEVMEPQEGLDTIFGGIL